MIIEWTEIMFLQRLKKKIKEEVIDIEREQGMAIVELHLDSVKYPISTLVT